MAYLPLIKDEAIYSLMIEEQAHAPTLVPTFLGYPVSWKPALFFWVGTIFSALPIPLEIAYRLPSFISGLITVPLVYLILKRTGASQTLAFFSTFIFVISYVSTYPDSKVLIDAPAFMLICSALYAYMRIDWGRKRYFACGLLIATTFFLKFILAAIIPVLAITYLFLYEKKALMDPLLWCSFLTLPAAFMLNASLLLDAGLGGQVGLSLASNTVSSNGFSGQIEKATAAITTLFLGGAIWFSLSLLGFLREWRSSLFMAFWFSLIIFPLITASFLLWYFLPVMPAVAYFASSLLIKWEGKERPDRLFRIIFALLAVVSIIMAVILDLVYYDFYNPEREVGLMLAGKENVMVVGSYSPTLVSSKMLAEWHSLGQPL
ncbi:MAG: glycosyltransferase family 39 protein, partial [Candidatus Micrarchaeota archaeon]